MSTITIEQLHEILQEEYGLKLKNGVKSNKDPKQYRPAVFAKMLHISPNRLYQLQLDCWQALCNGEVLFYRGACLPGGNPLKNGWSYYAKTEVEMFIALADKKQVQRGFVTYIDYDDEDPRILPSVKKAKALLFSPDTETFFKPKELLEAPKGITVMDLVQDKCNELM